MAKKTNPTMTICRKLKLVPIGDKDEINRVYKFIRDGQYAQYRASNLLMGQLTSEFYKNNMDFTCDEFKEARKTLMTNSNPLLDDIQFATGVDTKSLVTQKVKQDFQTALKNGLKAGRRTVTNYKYTNPLMTRARDLVFKHNYDSYQEFLDNINSTNLSVTLNWVNKIKFKVIFGNPAKSQELRSVIKNILEDTYKVCGSTICIDKKNIILNLSLQIPKDTADLDENIVVGVDLGLAIPAMCALNNNIYERKSLGKYAEFTRIRKKLQAQYKRLQVSVGTDCRSGGHGRHKKLQALLRLQKHERHFVETYSHMISYNVVQFALKHHAKYINIENLTGYNTSEFVLRNWSYYKLQQYITYKAERYGIIVRKINPCYTSQVCSICGHWSPNQRKSQSVFECANPNCASHKKYDKIGFNADFNGARNIAMSTLFMDDNSEVTEKSKTEAREYYGINKDEADKVEAEVNSEIDSEIDSDKTIAEEIDDAIKTVEKEIAATK